MDGESRGGGVADFLLKLHRISRTASPCDHRDVILKLVAMHLPFDLGIWAMGLPGHGLHGTSYYHRCQHFPTTYLPHASPRKLLHLLGSIPPGDAVNLDERILQIQQSARPMKKFLVDLPPHRTCCLVLRDQDTDLHHLFVFARTKTDREFTDHERAWMKGICPHAIDIGHHVLQAHLSEHASDGCTGAMVDRRGLIHTHRPDFPEILRKEWPDWMDPFLPFQLEFPMNAGDKIVINGRKVVMIASALGDFIHLRARLKSRTEGLSARERIITKHLVDGLTYKEISRSLGISACTVTKHVNSIYKKLHVKNKVQLANVVRSGARIEKSVGVSMEPPEGSLV